jgi:hypothetical protein
MENDEERATAYKRAEGRCECMSATCAHHQGRCCANLRLGEWQLVRSKINQNEIAIAVCSRCAEHMAA